jgi:hypothetical protein
LWEVTFENKIHFPKKCKPVSRVYVHHKAVNEKYIIFNDACIIHTDLMVKQNIYKYYYFLTLTLNSATFLSLDALVWLMSTVYPKKVCFD